MSFNQYLKSKNRSFTLSELITEYQDWLIYQGFYSPWIDAFSDVMDAMPSIQRAVTVTKPF